MYAPSTIYSSSQVGYSQEPTYGGVCNGFLSHLRELTLNNQKAERVPTAEIHGTNNWLKEGITTKIPAASRILDDGSIDGIELTPQEPERSVACSKAAPSEENAFLQRPSEDLEALHRATSKPIYSVFSERQRRFIVVMVACGGFFSPLPANIYFPALKSLAADLKESNEIINLSLTSYMIFQGLAPTVFGDLADMTGSRPTYILGFVIYIGANVGLALQNNYAALLILRCLQSTGSSGTVALGSGVVADIASSGGGGQVYG